MANAMKARIRTLTRSQLQLVVVSQLNELFLIHEISQNVALSMTHLKELT